MQSHAKSSKSQWLQQPLHLTIHTVHLGTKQTSTTYSRSLPTPSTVPAQNAERQLLSIDLIPYPYASYITHFSH